MNQITRWHPTPRRMMYVRSILRNARRWDEGTDKTYVRVARWGRAEVRCTLNDILLCTPEDAWRIEDAYTADMIRRQLKAQPIPRRTLHRWPGYLYRVMDYGRVLYERVRQGS